MSSKQETPTTPAAAKPSPRTPPHRSSFFSWVPTDEKQLYDCEATLLSPLYKIGFTQYHCAGLNTISLKATFTTATPIDKKNNTEEEEESPQETIVDPIFDLSALKQAQTKTFYEKWERKNSLFGFGSSSSSTSENKNSLAENTSSSSSGSNVRSKCMPVARTNPITVKHETTNKNNVDDDDSASSSSTPPIEIKVCLHHLVFVHGFAGGVVNWLPNLKATGDLVNKRNLHNLQKALPTNSNINNKSNKNTQKSNVVHLTILHAFDLPGFARSKRDENITFENTEGVIRYMTWSFNEWFKENEISATNSNVEKWIRRYNNNNNNNNDNEAKVRFVSAVDANDAKTNHQITLNGHSFGAYLSAHYCANYTSPFAISKNFVYAPTPGLTGSSDNNNHNKTEQQQDDDNNNNPKKENPKVPHQTTPLVVASSPSPTSSPTSPPSSPFQQKIGCGVTHLILTDPFGVAIFDPRNVEHTTQKFDWKWKLLANVMLGTMESALTPALRALGPWAPDIITNFRSDFLERWEGLVEDPKMIMDYIFHCNAQKANLGDHSMAKTVAPGSRAFANLPIFFVVPDLAKIDASVKVSLVYGAQSWMDKKTGRNMFDERRDQLKKFFQEQDGDEKNKNQRHQHQHQHQNSMGLCETLHNAGHQVNTDQPDLYNDFLWRTCDLKQY